MLIRASNVRYIDSDKYNISGLSSLVTGGETIINWVRNSTSLSNTRYRQGLPGGPRFRERRRSQEYPSWEIVLQRNSRGEVHVYLWNIIDFRSLTSLKSFCEKAYSEVNVLHTVVLNAEVNLSVFSKTIDGFEESFQVNFVTNAALNNYLVLLLLW